MSKGSIKFNKLIETWRSIAIAFSPIPSIHHTPYITRTHTFNRSIKFIRHTHTHPYNILFIYIVTDDECKVFYHFFCVCVCVWMILSYNIHLVNFPHVAGFVNRLVLTKVWAKVFEWKWNNFYFLIATHMREWELLYIHYNLVF